MFCKSALIALVAAAASLVSAASTPAELDVEVLNFALSLEHLENAFYTGGLERFSEKDFENAGLPAWVRGRFVQIMEHEAEHVRFLTGALGDKAVLPCNYKFPYDSPQSFAALSMVLETVGASAYLGGAQFLENKNYLTAAASILAVESRQASWVSASVMKLQPWNGPFDIPLTPSGAYSLAQPFIRDCPNKSPLVKTFPKLTLSKDHPARDSRIKATFSGAASRGQKYYVAWLDGLNVLYSDIDSNGMTTVPEKLDGTVYATVVSSKEVPSDANMLSGFAIAQLPFGSDASSTCSRRRQTFRL